MKILTLFLLTFSLSFTTKAQIIIDNTPTPASLVTNTLIGPGLVTSGITYSGNPLQIGFFDANTSNIGLDSGVVMTTGNILNIVPPLNPSTNFSGPGDADVLAAAQSVTSNPSASSITSTHDAAVLEFDFVPNGDVVIFRFVFASEEYLTYVNTQFNDAFGFFISGPNPAGGSYANDNLAIVPGTTEPITISTIYPPLGPGSPGLNAAYYGPAPIGHSFNGFSIPIEIRFNVLCDSTYHFKFAIADCQDGILDTGVFLEGGSFQAVPVDLSLETNIDPSLFGDSVIFEGCGTDADFVFTRPSCQSADSLYVTVDVTGTATNGVDYSLIPDSVLFLPGSTQVTIPFTAFQDGIFEGYEDVVVTVVNILPSGDTIITTGTIWLFDQPNVTVVGHDTTLFCIQDSINILAEGFNGVPPYTYTWNTSTDTINTITAPVNTNGSIDYYVTITDFCGFTDDDTLTVIVNQTLSIDSLLQFPASACNPDGAVSALVSGVTDVIAQPFYHWENQSNTASIDATVWQNIPSGWYYFTVTDDVCSESDSIFIEMTQPPIAEFSANTTYGCDPLNVTFTNSSQNTSSYFWDFGNGNTINVNSGASQSQTYSSDALIMLIAYDDNSCSDTAYVNVSVITCGCMDSEALNFNPLAVQDDGSCEFPVPSAVAPNVFTPNGDFDNDIFYLKTQYTVSLELSIVNRWGNVMYENTIDLTVPSLIQQGWNGTTKSGSPAKEGTYFYKYKATGIKGDTVEGHGFLELVRD